MDGLTQAKIDGCGARGQSRAFQVRRDTAAGRRWLFEPFLAPKK
jgi:hypothetical protein